MQEILRKAFTATDTPPPFQYVPYHARYHNIQTFGKAILKQATIEEDHRIVAIQGIHPENMFKFESILQQKFPKIKAVYETSRTTKLNLAGELVGRYNLLCLKTDFVNLAIVEPTKGIDVHREGFVISTREPIAMKITPRSMQ
jgi:hypothetical protein